MPFLPAVLPTRHPAGPRWHGYRARQDGPADTGR